jgi:hypothetical protein
MIFLRTEFKVLVFIDLIILLRAELKELPMCRVVRRALASITDAG